MPAGSTYTPLSTTTLGSAQTTVSFSSISSAYTDLILVCTGSANVGSNLTVRVGNASVDTGSNYSSTYLGGDGSAAFSGRQSSQTASLIGAVYTGLGINIINFQNYANTTTNKTFLSRLSFAGSAVAAYVGLWRSTSAINIITLSLGGTNTFSTGSTFTLYGIASA
jgi:hypothetical protein